LVFFLVWVRFPFFGFRLIKLKQTEPVSFFKILIGLISFFHGSIFLVFFSGFLGLISFLIFLLTTKF
jgi:hypothetical protein